MIPNLDPLMRTLPNLLMRSDYIMVPGDLTSYVA